MLTQEQVDQIKLDIEAGSAVVDQFKGVIDPKILPYIAIGQVVAAKVPNLIQDVVRLINKQEPTEEDSKRLMEDAEKLSDPNPDKF